MSSQFMHLLEIVIAASLINNFVFTRFLGLCIFFGVTKKLSTAVGMGITFTIIMCINAALSWLIVTFVLVPFELEFLKIVVFISIIAVLVQASETILKKTSPAFHRTLGIFLALITTNCIILAVPLISSEQRYSFPETMAFGLGSGLGFALALVIMGSLREKLELADVPRPFQGLPIAFMVAGMIALVFTGFAGLIKP